MTRCTRWLYLLVGLVASTAQADEAFERFARGKDIFDFVWVVKPSPLGQWGRGPLSNAEACFDCHPNYGRGHAPEGDGFASVSMIVRLSSPASGRTSRPHRAYGEQLQTQGVLGEVSAEGAVWLTWQSHSVMFLDGDRVSLRRPQLAFRDLALGAIASSVRTSLRIAPPIRGMGWLEAAVPAYPARGKTNRVWHIESRQIAVGKFGWKATQPDLRQQIAHAYHQDVGVTSRLFPQENCTSIQTACAAYPSPGHPELSDERLDDLTFLLRTLPAPERVTRSSMDATTWTRVQQGKKLFAEARCASCHTRHMKTGPGAALTAIAQRAFRPYSDMRLHDMGEGLADHRPEFEANGREWRTPPLWGLGNDHSSLLHDGRARTIAEAILWHGGEASRSRKAYRRMSRVDRLALEAFLESL